MRDQMMFSYEKFLGIHMFFFGRIMIAFSKRWQIGFIDWRRHDKVMCKSYVWSLYAGFVEIRLYQTFRHTVMDCRCVFFDVCSVDND